MCATAGCDKAHTLIPTHDMNYSGVYSMFVLCFQVVANTVRVLTTTVRMINAVKYDDNWLCMTVKLFCTHNRVAQTMFNPR